MRQSHPAQYVWRLGKLDIVVADDLYPVPPRVEKVEEPAGQRIDARAGQCRADCFLVVDHKSKMATVVSGLGTALLQREELVAKVDESRSAALAPKFEIEQSTIESQGFFDIANLESDVIETNGSRFSWLRHGTLQRLAGDTSSMTGTNLKGQATSTRPQHTQTSS